MQNRIYTWDWKYKIFFFNKVRLEVDLFTSALSEKERRVYQRIIEFYTSFYSFAQLLEAITYEINNIEALINFAEAEKNKIIATPSVMVPHYRKRIETMGLSECQTRRLFVLLENSIVAREITQTYWAHINELFGSHFDWLRDTISRYENVSSYINKDLSRIDSTGMEQAFEAIYQNEISNEDLIRVFGNSKIKDFCIDIQKGVGFAEWWDREISTSHTDTLVLYSNPGALIKNDFKYTVLHETYPGHGHFYNYVHEKKPPSFDHGAMGLIEGWATFVEWNSIPSEYISSVRTRALHTLWESSNLSTNERAEMIYRRVADRYGEDEGLRSVQYATQYIGFSDIYYLGALFFEKLFYVDKTMKPTNFFDMFEHNSCGEFFSLWM